MVDLGLALDVNPAYILVGDLFVKDNFQILDKSILKKLEVKIGNRLREARQAKNLTQVQLASLVSSSQDTIQKIENGHSLWPKLFVDLALAVDVNPAWLKFGDLCADRDFLIHLQND